MSFWKKLQETGKKAGKKVGEEAKRRIEERKLKKDKIELLNDLDKNDLINLCFEYDVPVSRRWDRDKIIKNIVDSDEPSLIDISKYMERILIDKSKIIRVSKKEDLDVEQEIIRTERIKTRVRRKKEATIVSTLRKQLKSFNPIVRRTTKERNVEAQMVQRLRAILGDEKVNYQERSRSGRIDVVVDNDYAIELKLMASPSQLTPLLGQAIVYSKDYKKLFVWIYDVKNSLKRADIKRFEKNLKDSKATNVEVIVKP